jgi:membrane-associated protein
VGLPIDVLGFDVLSGQDWVQHLGTAGVILAIFAETGILLGIFLPGDSLLFTAGVFCAQTRFGVHLNLAAVLIGTAVAAVLGGQCGYLIGRGAGPRLFQREESRFFRRAWLVRTREFLDRYGVGRALVLARFVPIVRTVINPLVGMLSVESRRFTVFNAIGGVGWTVLVVMLGWALGTSLGSRSIDSFILPVVAIIILISVTPIAVEYVRERRRRRVGTTR